MQIVQISKNTALEINCQIHQDLDLPHAHTLHNNDLFLFKYYSLKVYEGKLQLIFIKMSRIFSRLNTESNIRFPHSNGCLNNAQQERDPKLLSVPRLVLFKSIRRDFYIKWRGMFLTATTFRPSKLRRARKNSSAELITQHSVE